MKLVLNHVENHTNDLATFWFKPEKSIDFLAGQITELYIPHNQADSRGERRWFTIASSPTENLIAFTTKFTDKNGSSFKRALRELKPKQTIAMSDPIGDFVLPINKDLPLIFVAGGVGISPVRSITKFLIDTKDQRRLTVFYGVRDQRSLIFESLLREYDLDYRPSVAEHLDFSRLLEAANDMPDALIYLSGPEKMILDLLQKLIEHNISRSRIVLDYFTGY